MELSDGFHMRKGKGVDALTITRRAVMRQLASQEPRQTHGDHACRLSPRGQLFLRVSSTARVLSRSARFRRASSA